MEVKRPRFERGVAETLTIRSEEIREALQEPLSSILESVALPWNAVRPNCLPIWWIAAWSWPVVARYCAELTVSSRRKPAYRFISPMTPQRRCRRHRPGIAGTPISQAGHSQFQKLMLLASPAICRVNNA